MTDPSLDDVREYAGKAWQLFSRERNLNAGLTWADDEPAAGARMVSARVCGQGAANALQRFTADYHVVLGGPGDQRPQFDYTNPDRVACVWRKSGVWIELWVSAEQALERRPVPARSYAVREMATGEQVLSAPIPAQGVRPESDRSGLGARFSFTRKRRTASKGATR